MGYQINKKKEKSATSLTVPSGDQHPDARRARSPFTSSEEPPESALLCDCTTLRMCEGVCVCDPGRKTTRLLEMEGLSLAFPKTKTETPSTNGRVPPFFFFNMACCLDVEEG